MTSTSVLNFSFFVYCFLIPSNYLSVFTYSLLNFLKRAILCFLLGKSQISICLGLVTERLLLPFDGVMSLDISCTLKSCIAVFAFEVAFPPLVFTDWLWEKIPLVSHPCYGCWGNLRPLVDKPTPHFLLAPVAEVLSLYVFSCRSNVPGQVLAISLLFTQGWCYMLICGISHTCRFSLALCMCLLAVCQSSHL